MKALFLDIDSVLNSYDDWKKAGDAVYNDNYDSIKHEIAVYDKPLQCPISRVINIDMLNKLKYIIDQTKCNVIGISSWFKNINDIHRFNEETGLNLCDIGYYTGGSYIRYDAVLQYLNDNDQYTYAVILDDIPFMKCGLDNIHVCPKDGIDESHVSQCIDILNTKWRTLCEFDS
jgi:hypothetical protein